MTPIVPLTTIERMREVEQRLRFLMSCDAEAMSDYERINLFVRAGADAAALLQEVRRINAL